MQSVHSEAASSYSRVAREQNSSEKRAESETTPFRRFNNFVKTAVIQDCISAVAEGGSYEEKHEESSSSSATAGGLSVVDLCSGRGGDVWKWVYGQHPPLKALHRANEPHTYVTRYCAIDIAPDAVAAAEERFKEAVASMAASRRATASVPTARFVVGNCLTHTFWQQPLTGEEQKPVKNEALKERQDGSGARGSDLPPPGSVNIISVQFAFHYACASEENFRACLRGMAAALAPGGHLIISTVDAKALEDRFRTSLSSKPAAATEVTNDGDDAVVQPPSLVIYQTSLFSVAIRADILEESLHNNGTGSSSGSSSHGGCLALGTQYRFALTDLVACDEYAVPSDALIAGAEAASLRLVKRAPFSEYVPAFATNKKTAMFALSQDELDLVGLYTMYVFAKE